MKRFLLLAMLVSSVIACHESREASDQNNLKLYDKRVGEQIPLSVATRWAETFSATVPAGRTASTFSVDAAVLDQLISPVEDRLGVVFHHGLDDANEYRLMMYALDEDGQLFKNETIELSSGDNVDAATARIWANNYAESHPTTPWYHFFGSDVFVEIQSNDAFEYIDIVRGLNDESKEQVLLFVNNTKDVEGGRSVGEQVTVYDFSQPCPPCSSSN